MAKRSTIHEVINQFRQGSTMVDRGERFERLMVDYFTLDPTLSAEYDEVQRWPDWDHREGSHDSGIDLVARDKVSGEWTAIQCKFYDPRHSLQKQDIDSFFTASGRSWDGVQFANRIIISTTDRWSHPAEEALENQQIPVERIGLADIAESPIDWMAERPRELVFRGRRAVRYSLRPHQKLAIGKILEGFRAHDRGKWISACGTGKTFTSLRLAEQMCAQAGGHLKVLFLAPSISLVSQTLREWMGQSQTLIRPFVVCSDTKAGRQAEDITTHDIPLPTTDATRLAEGLAGVGRRGRAMTVVFSTYQSIDVVAAAQRESAEQFDLVLCDEAHRTTGVTLSGDTSESSFVKVHDNSFLPAGKRLYMTATPRVYGEGVKQKADEASAVLTSMDDEAVFGPEFWRLGFGQAVEENLLSDYKVMVLVVENDAIAEPLQESLAGAGAELSLDDMAKLVGCWNGLAKRTADQDFGPDPVPMKRAVAFLSSIKASRRFAEALPQAVDTLTAREQDSGEQDSGGQGGAVEPVCSARHVDGTMNALQRSEALAWLKAPIPDGETRVVSNARCLAEGVDVPALDAVLFLHPRNSMVDVIQSVGRVMRKAPGKDFGYVILPVAIPAGMAPEEAMRDNRRFKVVWDVLNALRSHDDRFNTMINSIDLDHTTKGKVSVDIIGNSGATDTEDGQVPPARPAPDLQPALFSLAQWKDAILARIVKKCGDRDYWDRWTGDVAAIHANQVTRITGLLATAGPDLTGEFDGFVAGLRANLNDSVDAAQAVDMLSQHLITKPVFDALFPQGSFAAHNPVSVSMQTMVAALEGHGLGAETEKLAGFYESVRRRAAQIETPAGRQRVIHELYEQFFKTAFPKQSSSLGVVYTPVPIVDFILRAADQVCRQQFGYGLSDEGVHVLDPFTGTGTFIVRLLESGIIAPADLARKYAGELWANEIMLLAYYIACVNIETTYQALQQEQHPGEQVDYVPFPGATLTDSFQITEDGDRVDTSLIPVNNQRIESQLATPIKVIVANPPYSVGQGSANDNNANLRYPSLDQRIADTYAAQSTATLKNSLYDSYVRAFRWATDRLGTQGVIGFVSNNGWVDGNTADGIRLTFAEEFSDIWVYNLRGNQRTAGETSRREGGKVFGSGARTGVAVLIAAKNPHADRPCRIHYFGVPDYQTRDDKLADLQDATLGRVDWQTITPNQAGDWLNQRNDSFTTYPPIGSKDASATRYFTLHTRGLATSRDAWCYNFSDRTLNQSVQETIDFYNSEVSRYLVEQPQGNIYDWVDRNPHKFSWDRSDRTRIQHGVRYRYDAESVMLATYRPFTKQYVYANRQLNNCVYRLPAVFPTPHHTNIGFYSDAGAGDFSVVMASELPDVHVTGSNSSGQFFPRWTYTKVAGDAQGSLLEPAGDVDEWGYRRVDNITDEILALYQEGFGNQVSKDDIFYYVYAVLHSPQYRQAFAADLKRMLPRIPLAASLSDFEAFTDAGRRLADLHVNYETVEPYPLHEPPVTGMVAWEAYRVTKMRWADKTTKNALIYNQHITLGDVPAEASRYMLGSRSALDWLIDRYQIKTDKASGIVNDPNDWAKEHGDPRYIIDLVKRITRVSIDTMRIVDQLPELPFDSR
ncbi:DEAD/DEAH box helicase [Propionibacterium freudenreichii]|uniref:DEAD/DEAH box helicase n=2 Tax=Propionibacterium freudenreichii TaxID=1744 RepID=UPI0018C59BF5|nr:DEAD/DEAH box helicase [Propionibacterium freudenreichii]